MSATATEIATARPSNLRVRVRVAALKLLLCSVRAANTCCAVYAIPQHWSFVFGLANVR